MASPSPRNASAFRPAAGARPWLALALVGLALSMFLVACEDDDGGDGETPSATGTSATSSPTATATGGGGGGSGGGSSYDDAYDSALAMALDAGIGADATDAQIASVETDVRADGEGLPEGSGTAMEGGEIYASQCATCHGEQGEGGGPGGEGPQLIIPNAEAWQLGDPKVIGNYWPYATTVYDYIRRAMPFLTPGSLSDDEVYAVTAYLLAENGVIEADEEMNADTLAGVEMPNRDRFVPCWPDACRPDVGEEAEGSSSPTGTATPTGTDAGTGTASPTGTSGGQ